MPSDPVSLTVTAGYLFPTSSSRIGATELNLAANPVVKLEANGALGPDFLNMTAVAEATGDAATRNYLQKGNFAYEDWQNGNGLSVPAGATSSNAQGWYARPTGGPVTVLRAEDSPGTNSTWSAELQAGASVTGLDYYTWIPPAVGSGFRAGNVTFSLYVRNLTPAPLNCRLFCDVASNTNERGTLINQVLGTLTAIPATGWTRLTLTVNASTLSLQKGSGWGLRTEALTTAGAAIRIGEAQFEAAATATTYTRPVPPAASLAFLSRLTDAERVLGAEVVVQLTNGELRLLPSPPTSIFAPVLGFDRASGIPVWIDSKGFIEVYQYTGVDQYLTVPASVTGMEVYCWGGGGTIKDNKPSGVGGFAYGTFPVLPGQTFTLMVGGAGNYGPTGAYGFGGIMDGYVGELNLGGGLSGLFSGTSTVLETDAARALLVAGGGGTADGNGVAGGNGGDTDANWAGGQTTMRGIAGNRLSHHSGGGGYAGGGRNLATGKGGTSYRRIGGAYPNTGSSTGTLEFTARTSPVVAGQQLIVPGSTNPKYQNQAGLHGRNGLIVVKWIV